MEGVTDYGNGVYYVNASECQPGPLIAQLVEQEKKSPKIITPYESPYSAGTDGYFVIFERD